MRKKLFSPVWMHRSKCIVSVKRTSQTVPYLLSAKTNSKFALILYKSINIKVKNPGMYLKDACLPNLYNKVIYTMALKISNYIVVCKVYQ